VNGLPEARTATSELAAAAPGAQTEDTAHGTIDPPSCTRATSLERAHVLGRRLGVQVAIDETGWLRREVELVLTREPAGTFRPTTIRVGCEASDDEVLAEGGAVAQCDEYNRAIGKLRQLAAELAVMAHNGRIALVAGSPVAYAHSELSRLDELIERRQRSTMGHGVVRLATLRREIEFFVRCDAHLAPIIHAAAGVANAAPTGSAPAARCARGWLHPSQLATLIYRAVRYWLPARSTNR